MLGRCHTECALSCEVTRAKSNLILLGNQRTLQKGSELWRNVLGHLQSTGDVLPHPSLVKIFSDDTGNSSCAVADDFVDVAEEYC